MSCKLTPQSVFFLLVLLRVQSIDLTHARSLYSQSDFEFPEVDGSAVDTCRIFPVPDRDTTTSATTTTTTMITTTPIPRKRVVATTNKPAVQSPPRKPETKNTGTPVRPQPAPAGPIGDSYSNPSASLLHYLLLNSRGPAAGPLPGSNSFISQPIGGLLHRGYRVTSDSDESAATVLKRAGRTNENRWKIGSFSSDDSSDES